jgi:hypothetical protein
VRRTFGHPATALIIYLRRRHVPVPEQISNTADIDTGIKEQRRDGRPERMRRVDADLPRRAIGRHALLHRSGKSREVA